MSKINYKNIVKIKNEAIGGEARQFQPDNEVFRKNRFLGGVKYGCYVQACFSY